MPILFRQKPLEYTSHYMITELVGNLERLEDHRKLKALFITEKVHVAFKRAELTQR